MRPAASADSAQTVFGTANGATATATGTISGGAATYRSDWVDVSGCVGVSFDIAWSTGSSPIGTWGLEVSNYDVPPIASVAAVILPLSSTPTALSGTTGISFIDAPVVGARKVRLIAVVTSGSCALTAVAYAKRKAA